MPYPSWGLFLLDKINKIKCGEGVDVGWIWILE